MKNTRMQALICLFVLASLVPVTSWAYGNDDQAKRRQGPPQEAIEACQGKQAGDSVEFNGRRGETITATCEERRDQLVAVPEGMRDRIRQRQR